MDELVALNDRLARHGLRARASDPYEGSVEIFSEVHGAEQHSLFVGSLKQAAEWGSLLEKAFPAVAGFPRSVVLAAVDLHEGRCRNLSIGHVLRLVREAGHDPMEFGAGTDGMVRFVVGHLRKAGNQGPDGRLSLDADYARDLLSRPGLWLKYQDVRRVLDGLEGRLGVSFLVPIKAGIHPHIEDHIGTLKAAFRRAGFVFTISLPAFTLEQVDQAVATLNADEGPAASPIRQLL